MTPPPTWTPELRALVETVAGRPLAELDWRGLVRVREAVSLQLDCAVNELQAPSPADAA